MATKNPSNQNRTLTNSDRRKNKPRRHLQRRLLLEWLETRTVFAGFSPGNVVVERVGDGTVALANAAAPIAVLEYTPSGSLVQPIPFPSSGANQQTESGTSTSNGYLNTYNGLLSVPGYDAASGTPNVATSNNKVNSILDETGAVANRTLFPTGGASATPPSPFSANNFRSSIATSSTTFYASGTASGTPNTGGVWYYDGSAFTQISSTASGALTNMRNLEIYNNQLYVSSSSGTFLGISSVGSGLPTSTGQSATLQIDLGTGGSPYGFVMFDTNSDNILDRAYIADDRPANANGGINRFDFNGTNWSRTAAFRFDTATNKLSTAIANVVAIRGLTGSYDPATSTATLYATTTENSNNRLISLLDGSTAWSTSTTFTTLQTAGANYVFRGVDFVPDGTPPSIAALAPADNATNVAVGSNLVATFNENIVKGTGNLLVKKSSDNSTAFTINVASAQVSVSGAALIIDPPADLDNSTEYYVQIPNTAVRDLAGNPFSGISNTTSWNFTTAAGADTNPPIVTALTPPDDATGVALNANLVLTFNENVFKGTGDLLIRRTSDDAMVETIDVASSLVTVVGDTVTINPSSDLAYLTGYYVQIPNTAFRDAASNFYSGLSDKTSWNFTTINDAVPPTVLSIDDGDANNKLPVNTTLTYTIIFSEDIDSSSVDASDFDNDGSAFITIGAITETTPGTFTVQVTPLASGTLKLRIPTGAVISDTAGNPLAVPVADNDVLQVFDDATPPTVVSISDDRGGTSINANLPIVYTITFSEDIELPTVSASDFNNAGTASITIASIAEPDSGVITLIVTPTSAGTLQLRIPTGAVIEDAAGNELVPPVLDDAVITVNSVTVLTAGDIAFTGIQSDDPDTFSFVLLKNVVDGTQIRFTDNRWNNATNTLATNENTLTLTFQNAGNGFAAGTHFVNVNGGLLPAFRVVGSNTSAGQVSGSISGLSTAGDSLLAYQGSAPTDGASSAWIAGINTRSWSSGVSNSESELPTALLNGVNAIQLTTGADVDNGAFSLASFVGSVAEIRSVVNNIKNWTTSNDIGPLSTTAFTIVTTSADLFISEVLFDPVASVDTGEEYIELRGTPNTYLPGTAYLLLLDGDSDDGAGNVDHRFYLGGMQFGSNGFLVLRQFNSTYSVDVNATVVTATASGWGASWSSRDTDIENGSVSVLLVLVTATPAVDVDVDTNNDGNLDGDAATWSIRDSIGNIDGGASDTGYGVLNTTGNGNGSVPTGSTLVNLSGYHPDYMARNGNSTGYSLLTTSSSDWVVGELAGAMPTIALATGGFTRPSIYAGAALNHLGAVNIFAPPNNAPTDISLSSASVAENAGANAPVGTFSTTDPDAGNTFTYTLVAGSGDTDNAAFNINGTTLRATSSFDFETKSSYTVRVRSTDQGGLFTEKTFSIAVTNVNEAPALTRSQASLSGNVLSAFTNAGTWSDPEGDPVAMTASLGTVTKNADGTWSWSFAPSQAYANQTVTITGTDDKGLASQVQFTIDALVAVVNSKVYYKGSSFAGTGVDAAIDTSKVIANSGTTAQALTFANLVNTTRGINGLVFDVAGLAASSLTASDFVFRMSPTGAFNEAANPPSSWVAAPAPTLIHVTAGTATAPARVRLEWADNAIANRWLQIKVLANANTGLTSPQVFYIGHLYGEVNGVVSGGVFSVSIGDATAIRPNVGFAAPVTSPFDLDKSGSVSIGDITGMRPRVGIANLRVITIPPAGSTEEGESGFGGIPSFTPIIALPNTELSSDRAISQPSEIQSRLTDQVFDLPLPANGMQVVADTTPWQTTRSANDLLTDSASPQDMLSLDEFFRRWGKSSLSYRSVPINRLRLID